jgi:hypothetical protein
MSAFLSAGIAILVMKKLPDRTPPETKRQAPNENLIRMKQLWEDMRDADQRRL